MARYRLNSIAQLARQMAFAPSEVRAGHIARAEDLLHAIDPLRAYPLDFVIYRITEYRPKQAGGSELLTGLALQHDLGMFIEQVSDSLARHVRQVAEPVLAIEDVCEKFNVTSKTIQRWRRKGLPARRFIFDDGKRRVGFLLSSVERFLRAHREQAAAVAPPAELGDLDQIIAPARQLAQRGNCIEQVTRRLARRFGRSPMAILHILRKHDTEHPAEAVLPALAPSLSSERRGAIIAAAEAHVSLVEIAHLAASSRSAVYQAILDHRIAQLRGKTIRFHDDPLFHGENAAATIESLLKQDDLPDNNGEDRIPRGLPAALEGFYRAPLLTRSRERALFLKLNFHKFRFVHARQRLDPETARSRDLRILEDSLRQIAATRQAIVSANLRLVVSVARNHLRPGVTLEELLSEGSLVLIRAVDGFDVSRGNRFSTYATFALMKGFARTVPQMLAESRRSSGDPELLKSVPDQNAASALTQLAQRDEVRALLSRLDDQRRGALLRRYGLTDAVS